MATEAPQNLSLVVLTGTVVGSMVDAGIFSLCRTFGAATGPFGAIIAWVIAAADRHAMILTFVLGLLLLGSEIVP